MAATGADSGIPTEAGFAAGCRKFAALLLSLVIVGLPINGFFVYALMATAILIIFLGKIRSAPGCWLTAVVIVSLALAGQNWLAPPRIDEGHNVFLPGGPTQALKRGLPGQVYDQLAADFAEQYPPEKACKANEAGCWLNMGFPDRTFAFSADGIFHKSDFSRSVTGIDFSDPTWLGLGFINEYRYNWYTVSDVQRAGYDRRFWMGWKRWHLTMPWFEMIRLPATYVGGQLCWSGDLMWEGDGERYTLLRGDQCRTIEPADAGRRIVGLAIKPTTLAMRLTPPLSIRLLQIAHGVLTVGALLAVLMTLVSLEARRLIVPSMLIGLTVVVVALHDISFLGGLRALDAGNDGLFYDGVGRMILQSLLNGDYITFLIGFEKVFYYGGPGLRYFRAFEHVIFGETFLGYLSLILLLPLLVYGLFRRFLSDFWAVILGLIFIAIPVGHVSGTTFINYLETAERGYADPAAYILFIAGLLPLLGAKPRDIANGLSSDGRFAPAFFGALLIALGIAMKPIIAPAAAVFLGGTGLAAIYFRQWRRLAGMCVGFLPVFLIPLHNWVFGNELVLFSTNATHPLVLNMPPAAYADAFRELISLNFSNGQFARALMKVREWMSSGPSRFSPVAIAINALGVAILFYVVLRGRRFDPWLRLVGAAAMAQHAVALLYVPTPRYHYLTWFLTALVALVYAGEVGGRWLRRRFPDVESWVTKVRPVPWLASR